MAESTHNPAPVNATPENGNGGPDPEQAPEQAPEPSVATTLSVEASAAPLLAQAGPGSDGPNSGEGGEWELLLQKLREWLNQGQLQSLWAQASKPVTLLAALVGLPLVPGLLELAGVVWMVRYGVPKLLRSSEREQLLGGLSKRWKSFRGQG